MTENILKASSTSISPTSAAAVVGQGVNFTATVSGSGGTPTGSVTFVVDGINQAPVALNGADQASLTINGVGAGNHSVTAVYSGDSTFAPSSPGAPANLSVSAANTSTSMLNFTGSPTVAGQMAIYIATVTPQAPGGGLATGTLQFVVDGVVQPPVPLNGNGQAGLDTASLPVGTHTIGAIFNGSANYHGSTAAAISTTINRAQPTISVIEFGPAPTSVGQLATFILTVTPPLPGSPIPTGGVQFIVDNVPQPVLQLNGNGQAGLYTTTLSAGQHNILASYGGNALYLPAGTPHPFVATVVTPTNAVRLVGTVNGPVVTNTPFSVSAQALDSQGNLATSFNQPAVLSVVSAPAGGFLSGNPNGTFSGGTLTLNNLEVNVTGTYTINITAGGMVVTLSFTTSGRQT